MGISPPARKLASWPLYAISVGSARLWKYPFVLSALMTVPTSYLVLNRNKFRKSVNVSFPSLYGLVAGGGPMRSMKPGAGNCSVVTRPIQLP